MNTLIAGRKDRDQLTPEEEGLWEKSRGDRAYFRKRPII